MPSKFSSRDRYSIEEAQDIGNRYERRSSRESWVSQHAFQLLGVLAAILMLGGVYLYLSSNQELGSSLSFASTAVLVLVLLALASLAAKMATTKPGYALGIFAAILIVGFFFNSSILNAAVNAVPLSKEFFNKYRGAIDAKQNELLKDVPPEVLSFFMKPKSEAPATRGININPSDFINAVNRTPFNSGATLRVLADEDLKLKIQCLLDKVAISTSPTDIDVKKADSEQSFQVKCSNSVSGKELSVKVEAPFVAEAVQEVSIGSGAISGKTPSSTMQHDSPYSLSIEVLGPQVLVPREEPYPIYIKLFRQESGATLKNLKSLKINSQSQLFTLSCEEPLSELEFSGDRAALDSSLALENKQLDRFIFVCQLEVKESQSTPVRAYINATASYLIEKEFKTTIRQP